MDLEALRNFKHELRTPVNHIIGYSELLLDAATDAGNQAVAEQAKNIHSNGKKLASLIESGLSLSVAEVDQQHIERLRNGMKSVIDQIAVQSLLQEMATIEIDSYPADLARIRLAANRLVNIIDSTA
jgi:signal transduction histidine kinase